MRFPDLIQAVTPVVAVLERLGVGYCVGGSVASTAYGFSRTTQDVDLIAALSRNHVPPLLAALQDTYYANAQAMSEAIARRSCFNLIHLATSFKVDVFPAKDREYDRVALGRARKRPVDQEDPPTQLFLASPEDVVLSKLEWFRLGNEASQTQWRDVIGVLKVQAAALDRSYLQEWAAKLGIADLLEKAQTEAAK